MKKTLFLIILCLSIIKVHAVTTNAFGYIILEGTDPADYTQYNTNFTIIGNQGVARDSSISTLQSDISNLSVTQGQQRVNIDANSATGAINTAGIATNVDDIATNVLNISANATDIAGKEDGLGNPSTNDYILVSNTNGVRSWRKENLTAQTPWISDHNAATYSLTNVTDIVVTNGVTLNRPYSFFATKTNLQSFSAGLSTKVTWDAESWDEGGGFNLASNRFEVPVKGKYLFQFNFDMLSIADGKNAIGIIYKNSSQVSRTALFSSIAGANLTAPTVVILDLITSDKIEAWIYNGDSVSRNIGFNSGRTFFTGYYIGE